MKPISSRTQFRLVAVGYAAVFVVAAALLYAHYLVERLDPAAASGGMAAAGDTILYLFIGCLFLVPTALLIWTITKLEAPYTAYSRFLVGLSLSAPVCLSVVVFGENHVAPERKLALFLQNLGVANSPRGNGYQPFRGPI